MPVPIQVHCLKRKATPYPIENFPEHFGELADGEGGDVLDAVGEHGGRPPVLLDRAPLERRPPHGPRPPEDPARAARRPRVARRELGTLPLKLHGIHS